MEISRVSSRGRPEGGRARGNPGPARVERRARRTGARGRRRANGRGVRRGNARGRCAAEVDESASIERGKETLVPPEDFRRPRLQFRARARSRDDVTLARGRRARARSAGATASRASAAAVGVRGARRTRRRRPLVLARHAPRRRRRRVAPPSGVALSLAAPAASPTAPAVMPDVRGGSCARRLTLVLVGQTGNGKSATGNSLLGRDAFAAKRSLASVTESCASRVATLDARDAPVLPDALLDASGPAVRAATEICVVDTPGTCDSGRLLEDNLRAISAFLRGEADGDDALADDAGDASLAPAPPNPDSAAVGDVHALVLVLSAGARFTQEEAVATERLIARLGEGILDHTLAVFTRGGDVLRDETTAEELYTSAPESLRRLLSRTKFHADGAAPVLVENKPLPGDAEAFRRIRRARRDAEGTIASEDDGDEDASPPRVVTAARPLLAAVRSMVASLESAGADPGYSVSALRRAASRADADPATAALATLDRLKRRLADMAAGAGDSGGARDAMAAGAMRAFEDLQAQFAARAGAGAGMGAGTGTGTGTGMAGMAGMMGMAGTMSPPPGIPGGGFLSRAAPPPPRRPRVAFTGPALRDFVSALSGDDAPSAAVLDRVEMAAGGRGAVFAFDAALETAGAGGGGVAVAELERGDRSSEEERGTPEGFEGDQHQHQRATPRARVSGRVHASRGSFALVVGGAGDVSATIHSPAFFSLPAPRREETPPPRGGDPFDRPSTDPRPNATTFARLVPARPVSDDDWVADGPAYACALVAEESARAPEGGGGGGGGAAPPLPSIRVVVRGVLPGRTPDVALEARGDASSTEPARFEVGGGCVSAAGCSIAFASEGEGAFAFEGTLDATPAFEANVRPFEGGDGGEGGGAAAVRVSGRGKRWPWAEA